MRAPGKKGGPKRISIWKPHVYERFQGQQAGERRQSIGSGAPAPVLVELQAVLGERHAASLGVAAGGREMRVEAVCKAVKEATGGDGRGEERRESRSCGWVGGWVGVSFLGGGHSSNTLKGDQKENHHWGSPCFDICLFFGSKGSHKESHPMLTHASPSKTALYCTPKGRPHFLAGN